MTPGPSLDTALLEAFRMRGAHDVLSLADLARFICGTEDETRQRIEALRSAGLIAGPMAATLDGGRTWFEHGYSLSIRGQMALDEGIL
jgi:hypothetical protein